MTALSGNHNVWLVDDALGTSGQPTVAQPAEIAAAGCKVVINLTLHDNARHALPDDAGLTEPPPGLTRPRFHASALACALRKMSSCLAAPVQRQRGSGVMPTRPRSSLSASQHVRTEVSP